ncbi:MAG TPA: hypothetical protein VE439_08890 [Anaerolineae bacterium]|nr:hypothetical protein [Anaerolineae bacterium]
MHYPGRCTGAAASTRCTSFGKLRELLEPRGLWEKILDVNGRLLKELLDDEASQGELRKLIDTAKEVEEISYVLYEKGELVKE